MRWRKYQNKQRNKQTQRTLYSIRDTACPFSLHIQKILLRQFPTIPEEYFIDPYLFLNNFFFVAFYTLVLIYLIMYNYSADGNVFPLASHSVRTGTVPLTTAALTPDKWQIPNTCFCLYSWFKIWLIPDVCENTGYTGSKRLLGKLVWKCVSVLFEFKSSVTFPGMATTRKEAIDCAGETTAQPALRFLPSRFFELPCTCKSLLGVLLFVCVCSKIKITFKVIFCSKWIN